MAKTKKAFTLFELLIVVGIITISGAIVLPVSTTQIQTTKIEAVVKDIRSRLFTLQQDSYSRKNNTGHGIRFSSSNYIIFSGNSFETATDSQQKNLTNEISISQINLTSNQIFFANGNLSPDQFGSVVVSDGIISYRININKIGLTNIERL